MQIKNAIILTIKSVHKSTVFTYIQVVIVPKKPHVLDIKLRKLHPRNDVGKEQNWLIFHIFPNRNVPTT